MKRANKYVCDTCHRLLDPRAVYSVSIAQIGTDDLYHIKQDFHFCPQCLRLAQTRIEQSIEEF